MVRLGSVTPLLSFVIAGEFQFVILPRYMFATTGPVSLRRRTPGRLNATPVALSAQGIWMHSLQPLAWAGVRGASDAPKSPARAETGAIPVPDPTAAQASLPRDLRWKSEAQSDS